MFPLLGAKAPFSPLIVPRLRSGGVLEALYGVGMGRIPMHLRAEEAVLDGGGNVVSVPNRGGAGGLFNATASSTGITRTGGLLNISGAETHLRLNAPADMVGTRLFFVARADNTSNRYPRILGSMTPQNLARPDMDNGGFLLQRAGSNVFLGGSQPIGLALRLYEIEIAGGVAKTFIDGVPQGQAPCTWTDFTFDMIGAAFSVVGFTGSLGDPLSLVTDGSAAQDGAIKTIRLHLAAKYGIALPLSAYYGTGLGQIPFHLPPEDAVLDGTGNVVSLANRGGAGAAFNTRAGGAAITRTNNRLVLPTASAWLDLANPADLNGTRLFFVGVDGATRWRNLASYGTRTIQFTRGATARKIRFSDGTSWWEPAGQYSAPPTLALYELEKAAGRIKLFVNGALVVDSEIDPLVPEAYPLGRLFSTTVPNSDDWAGEVGDILSVVTTGSADLDGLMLAIRRNLASKHGIVLA